MENKPTYIKTDDNKVIKEKIKKKYKVLSDIRWVKKMGDCMEVCARSNGCVVNRDTHRICKLYNLDSYNKLNKLFE